MLHIVKSQASIPAVCCYAHRDDVILLIEDAVYCANPKHQNYRFLQHKTLFCLSEDVDARGLTPLISDSVQLVDYRGFVGLTAQYFPSMTWN